MSTFSDDFVTIHHGDCLDVMRGMDADSIDAIVTDPPYGLSFMGRDWDHGVPGEHFWREALRVAKPGCHLVAFGGTRTYHRLAVAIEDAGWEVRDCLGWLYGSGFPKSLDVSKAIDKRGGVIPWQVEFAQHLKSIKPATVRVADINAHVSSGTKSNFWGHFTDTTSQPLLPTFEQYERLKELLPIGAEWDELFAPEAEREVIGTKTSGIANKDESPRHTIGASKSVECDITAPATPEAERWQGWGTALKPAWEPIILARKPLGSTVAACVQTWGTGALNIDECRVKYASKDDAAAAAAEQRSRQTDRNFEGWGMGAQTLDRAEYLAGSAGLGRWPANIVHDGSDEVLAVFPQTSSGKMLPTPVDAGERGVYAANSAFTTMETYGDSGSAARFFYCAKADKGERDDGIIDSRNTHPTVKPLDLMRWLVRLVTPPDGIVLDPFMGSGTTLKAARAEGHTSIGIDLDAAHCEIAWGRLSQGVLL